MDMLKMKKISDTLVGPYPDYEVINFYFNDQNANYAIVSHTNKIIYITDDGDLLINKEDIGKNWVIYTF